jgi:hypothetical protein
VLRTGERPVNSEPVPSPSTSTEFKGLFATMATLFGKQHRTIWTLALGISTMLLLSPHEVAGMPLQPKEVGEEKSTSAIQTYSRSTKLQYYS